MKLHDIIKLDEKIEKQNFSSLVRHLEKMKYSEFISISDTFDDPIVLKKYYNKWQPIHYAALNKDYKILNGIIKLYNRHQIPIDSLVLKSRSSIPENSNIMDIAYKNCNFFNIILLDSYNIKPSYLNKKSFSLLGHSKQYYDENEINKKQDYYLNTNIKLPYPNNILTPLIYNRDSFSKGLNFFTHLDYEEKEKQFKDFYDNLNYLYNNSKEHTMLNKDLSISIINVFLTLTNKFETSDTISFNETFKNNLNILFLPIIHIINNIYDSLESNIPIDKDLVYSLHCELNFNQNIYKNNNEKLLQTGIYSSELINTLADTYKKLNIINLQDNLENNSLKLISILNEIFSNLNKVLLFHKLNEITNNLEEHSLPRRVKI